MSIDNMRAAKIARSYGLSLADAAALARLADNVQEAEKIARLFADESQTDPRKLAATFPRTGGGR